jgi:alpha-ketoglutarate-dependent 2,4-dichlorophenoxyacetate dioxygenase
MSLSIRPLTPCFGAEIRGVDLRRVTTETFAEIYRAFLQFGVLVIPGQPLSIEEHLAFASRFGELWTLPVYGEVPHRIDNPAIDDVSNLDEHGNLAGMNSRKVRFALGNQLWHSDLSFRDVPAQASLLHAVEIADEGGETEFADLHAPYDALPRERRNALEGLR